MNIIKLYNRDGANLWLEKTDEKFESNYIWELKVDNKYKYCLEYIRCIGDSINNIEAIDPSGGPMISVGDILNKTYRIDKIISPTKLVLWEL